MDVQLRRDLQGRCARVREILIDVLGRGDIDDRPLSAVGGGDPGIRRLIARAITIAFPDLDPPWTEEDVHPDSTLGSLCNEIDGRSAPKFLETASSAFEREEPLGVRARVRAILQDRLGRDDVEERPIGEIGGDDPNVRRLIARDIRIAFPDLNPPWTTEDVTAESTLDSLANEVDGRSL